MPEVTLKATKDFSYATRRMKAGDEFTVSARDAKILIAIKKAEELRQPGRVPAPPPRVVAQAATAAPSRPVPAVSTSSASAASAASGKPKPSLSSPRKRRTTRKSTAKKG